RKAAHQAYNAARAEGAVRMMDGADVVLTSSGYREVQSHSGDRRVLDIMPSLRDLMARAVPLWEDAARDATRPNVKAFRNYGVKVGSPAGDYYVRFVVRVGKDGRFHYDHDATSVEALQSEGPKHQPGPLPKQGEGATSLAKNRLAQWFRSVNENVDRGSVRGVA